jgi:hypothetical protein
MICLVGVSTRALLTYNAKYPEERLNLLVSYARLTRDTADFLFKHRHIVGSVILDSGTYSLVNNPQRYANIVTLTGYRAYLEQLGNRFDFYFNFDQNYSREGFPFNLGYQLYLENEGLNPVPVVHDCYGPEIQYYIDHGYKMVAIGSGELEDQNAAELYRIVNKLYSRGIKVHFLGCTEYEKLAYVPVYSADSATWNQAGSRGHLLYWNPNSLAVDKTERIRFIYGLPRRLMTRHIDSHPDWLDIEAYLNHELSYTIEDLKGSQGSFKRLVANIHFYVKLEKRIAAVHRQQGFKFWV